MLKDVLQSIKLTLLLFLLCSVAYTFLIWGIGRIFFPFEAGGSIFYEGSKPAGSLLIGENFNSPYIFDSRPSSAGNGYDGSSSSASNYGPSNKKYIGIVKKRINAFLKENPSIKNGSVPTDLVTGSGSGLDPFISAAGALAQVRRISRLTGVNASILKKLVLDSVSPRSLGIFGTPGVNTVRLNLKLASLLKKANPKIYGNVFKGLSGK